MGCLSLKENGVSSNRSRAEAGGEDGGDIEQSGVKRQASGQMQSLKVPVGEEQRRRRRRKVAGPVEISAMFETSQSLTEPASYSHQPPPSSLLEPTNFY